MWEFLARLEARGSVGNDHQVSHRGQKAGRSPGKESWKCTSVGICTSLPKGWVWRGGPRAVSDATVRIFVVSHAWAQPNYYPALSSASLVLRSYFTTVFQGESEEGEKSHACTQH